MFTHSHPRLQDSADLREDRGDAGGGLKKDFDHRDAVEGL
jgi:hypothetical protein